MSSWFGYFRPDGQEYLKVRTAPVTKTGDEVDIPEDADWTDRGIIINPGGSGSWDVRLSGALSPCTAVKKGDTYFLYYIGADGNRSFDGGPRHRALGVAYGTDGINFTKYGGNPILTFLPHNGEEEGIFSAGAFLDDNGEIVLYYSALDNAGVPETVNSDVRLAVSSNGLDFSDQGEVLSHDDSGVAGYGDELFPVGSFREGNTFYVYYINQTWSLYLAQGPARNNINGNTQKILSASDIKSGSPQRISPIKIAISLCRATTTEMRTALISAPQTLSAPVETYTTRVGGIYLDVEEEEAPVAPSGCAAHYKDPDEVYCTWQDNSDDEIGFRVEYSYNLGGSWNFFENVGANVEQSSDLDVSSYDKIRFRVRAYNDAGSSSWSVSDDITLPKVQQPIFI